MDFGVLSLLPSLIAIGLAIKTKNVIFSLFCGCLTGVLLLCHGNPFLASKSLIGDYFFKQVMDSYNAGNIVLILFIGGFIKLLENGGGAQSFAKYVHKVVDTPLKAQLGAWLGGVVIFFTDLGTALLVGPVFRPLFDKLKLSREKLAWVLDSTSSPVAMLMPLAIPMGHAFGISYAICLGAVLSGGLFGDHCSPLSDTTILSSMCAPSCPMLRLTVCSPLSALLSPVLPAPPLALPSPWACSS